MTPFRSKLMTLVMCIGIGLPAQALPPKLPAFAPLVFNAPKTQKVVLENGLILFLLEDHELPLIRLSATFTGGTQADPPTKLGLGSIFDEVLTHGGSLSHSSEEIEKRLDLKAASLSFSVGMENASGSLRCRAEDFDDIFGIFVELVRQPLFRKDQLNLAKEKMLEGLRRLNDDPDELARREFRKLIYGSDHPYARVATPATVRAITREDLFAYHRKFFHPNGTMIALSGDFESAKMIARVRSALGDWPRQDIALTPIEDRRTPVARGVFYIQRPIKQSQIRMGKLGLARHDPDHYAWQVFNELWGGSATSWLFSRVRTQMGLAYSVGSGYSEPEKTGILVAVSQTRGPQTIAAVNAMRAIGRQVSSAPFSESDVRAAKEAIQNRFIQNYTSSAQIAQQAMHQEFFRFPSNYLETYTERIGQVSLAELRRVGQRFFSGDDFTLLLIGDLSTFDQPVASLGKAIEIRPPDYSQEEP